LVRSGEPPEAGVTVACSVTLALVLEDVAVDQNKLPVKPSVACFLLIVSVPLLNENA
jgi:hypothetical protein